MAELKFREVQRQILLTDVMIGSDHATLEQRPKRIDVRSLNFAANVLASRVRHGIVREAKRVQIAIALPFIGRDQINLVAYHFADEAIKGLGVRVLDHLADYIAFPADGSDNRNLVAAQAGLAALFVPVLVLVLAAEISLVHFNDTHQLAKFGIVHRGAEPMAHEPSRSVRPATDLALNLESAHAFFGVEHLPEDFKPRLKRVIRVLKDGFNEHREAIRILGVAFLANPMKWSRIQRVDLFIVATRTLNHAVRPTPLFQILLAGIVSRKGCQQLFEGHHAMKDSKSSNRSQVRHNCLSFLSRYIIET